jgi:hypothetical protein
LDPDNPAPIEMLEEPSKRRLTDQQTGAREVFT